LKFFGDWNINFSGVSPQAWNMENDSKRLTLVQVTPSDDTPLGTLTIDNVGEQSQTWHFVTGNATTYNHYIYSLERTTKPN
jgi:hypothetical protein